jgi:carbonic anhydrase
MTRVEEILRFNREFVENREYEVFRTSRYPDKKLVILTCMDTRLTELLPKALNLKNGDAKIIKNAGALVLQPFGNVMRSILVALYELNATEVLVIGHHDCGMTGLDPERVIAKMGNMGVDSATIRMLEHAGIDLKRWLIGFHSVRESVEQSVSIIRNHPLLPKGVPVHGMIIDPETGKLELVTDGYAVLQESE